MSKIYYDLYQDSVISLAETLVIKSEYTAEVMNNRLTLLHGAGTVIEHDKTTWKYYKNICGELHLTDPQISVVSLDTLQNITFTRDNLTISPATRIAYQYGTRNYNELVSLYPDMEMFILGVLYPADMEKAINALDGTVLAYPSFLVDPQEVSLIKNINEWIRKYRVRWFNQQFAISDNMYVTVFLGQMYLFLVPLIMNLRLAACKSPEAHNYHIRQYLASHSFLDIYINHLTLKQALFFYRNISYIERNSGKREIFSWLVEHIMTDRNLPLHELTMKHDLGAMPNSLYANTEFRRKKVNDVGNALVREDYTLAELLFKQQSLTTGNPEFIEQNSPVIQKKFEHSLSNVVATKVLESAMVDYTDATPYTFYDLALNHWLAWSATNFYSAYVVFKNPKTSELITLHCKDAFVYFYYAMRKATNYPVVNIPRLTGSRVLKPVRPTPGQMLLKTDRNYVTYEQAVKVLSYVPVLERAISVETFKAEITEIFDCNQIHLKYVASQHHHYKRALVMGLVDQLYTDKNYQFEQPDTLFSTWLESKNLPADGFTGEQWLQLHHDIYEAATGTPIDSTTDSRELQKAMIGMLEKLSSYSIQFISSINGSNIIVLNPPTIRVGDVTNISRGYIYSKAGDTDVLNADGNVRLTVKIPSSVPIVSIITSSQRTRHLHSSKWFVNFNQHGLHKEPMRSPISKINTGWSYSGSPTNLVGLDSILGFSEFSSELNPDIWSNYGELAASTAVGVDIATIILDSDIDTFVPIGIPLGKLTAFVYEPIGSITEGIYKQTSSENVTNGIDNNGGSSPLNVFASPNNGPDQPV